MDAAPWPQEVKIGKTMEEISSSQCARKAKPQEQINCPRCNSTNTKFCYYNNYSLTQPRYFCKTCRRYWTEGGSLRNVPVGGGSRKNKRSSSSSSSSSSAYASASVSVSVPPSSSSISSKLIPDLNPPNLSHFSSQNPKSLLEGQDLNLAFPVIQDTQAMELLRTEIATTGLNPYIQTPNTLYSPGYPMQEFKPTLSFPVEENGGRVLFPLGEFKHQLSSATHHHNEIEIEIDQNKGHDQGANTTASTATTSAGFWNGMFAHGNGGSW